METVNAKTRAPEDYVPLSPKTLKVGTEYGPVSYKIRQESHDKSVDLLRKHFEGNLNIQEHYLLPSEMWGMARVLSSHYGRLNEAMAIANSWKILGNAKPEDELIARSRLVEIKHVKDLPVAKFETITLNNGGRTLLISIDDILMLHGIEREIYKEGVEPREETREPQRQGLFTVYDRMNWDQRIWLNNIHTDWAKKFGYEEGLPEFATFMDLIYTFANQGQEKPKKIDVKRIWPFYVGDKLEIKSYKTENGSDVTFSKDGLLKLIAEVTQPNH